MKLSTILILFTLAITVSCSKEEEKSFSIFSQNFDFSTGDHGWEADFTDYPVPLDQEDSVYKWTAEYTSSPTYLGGGNALMLSCYNANGEVFMFIKKKMTGFIPNTDYTIGMEIQLASDAAAGQGIILKAGASGLEPKKVIENNYYSLNIDKGLQHGSGEHAVVIGEIGTTPGADYPYTEIVKGNTGTSPLLTKSNSRGEIWLLVGTDSGYIGSTTVYYQKISVVFSLSQPAL